MDNLIWLEEELLKHFAPSKVKHLLRIIREDMPDLKDMPLSTVSSISEKIIGNCPIQYVTGLASFYGYFFNVNSSVLIPRPETEELVHQVLKYIKSIGNPRLQVLDIGSGSGCIPITIDIETNMACNIESIDIDGRAIEVAKSNAAKYNSSVKFFALDFLDELQWSKCGQYDIIISNPPYIPLHEKALMHSEVLDYEPHLALFVDGDPLIFYKKILSFSVDHLSSKGAIFLECNEFNAFEVEALFRGHYQVELINDLQGKNRMVKAIR